jgi:acetyl-CoA carboxylase carboxyl transferase subunit alpha
VGGSGGALAIGVGDRMLMLEYSIYSVISPEGCASILWKSAEKASDAAAALGVTSQRLLDLKLIDEIIEEPLGGAHRDPDEMAKRVREKLVEEVELLGRLPMDQLIAARYQRLMSHGEFVEK